MPQALDSILSQLKPNTLLDIGIVAFLIYWLFSLIRGTRAVSLVIGVTVLFGVYALAVFLGLRLLTEILQLGAYVGVFALVVVFQPELRRALEEIGRAGSFSWLLASADQRSIEHVATDVARAATLLSGEGHGALIVLERGTRLGEIAESGVAIDGDLSVDLLLTIFMPKTALHDGAVIIRDGRVLAAGALLPLAETTIQSERFGTRHRAALGITEQTDAVVVVVSEENGQISLVERGRIVRNLSEAQLTRAVRSLLDTGPGQAGRLRWRGSPGGSGRPGAPGARPSALQRLTRTASGARSGARAGGSSGGDEEEPTAAAQAGR